MGLVRSCLETLDSRRLLAFNSSGISTVTGTEYQSIDQIVPVDGGFIAAGTFSAGSNFGTGFSPTPRGYSDVFVTLVKGSSVSGYAIGGGEKNDGKPKFREDYAEFAALPRRLSEDYLAGVSSSTRRLDEYVRAAKIGPDGKLYVAVVFRNSISLNTQNTRGLTLTSNGEFNDFYDSAILKYSVGSKLNFESVIQIGGPFNDVVNDIDFDSAGNLIVVGSFERQCDFDPSSGTKLVDPLGRGDAFVAKYSAAGVLQYVSAFGSDTAKAYEAEAAYGVAVDSGDNIYVAGVFAGKADFDPRAGKANRTWVKSEGFTDAFTMKLNSDGTLNWVRAQGGKNFDGMRDVALAPGGVYSVGYFEDKADLDPSASEQIFRPASLNGKSTPYATDLFSNRYDANGNLTWVKPLAGEGFELLASASSDADGNLILAGDFQGKTDFDPSKRTHILDTPESDVDDNNQKDRNNAYSGFVARYAPTSKLIDVVTITAAANQDIHLTTAALDASGNLYTAGRYRVGLTVGSTSVGGTTSVKGVREDAFAVVFGSDLAPIV